MEKGRAGTRLFLFGVDPRPPGNGRNFKRKFTNEGDFPSCPLPPLWPPSVSNVATETAAREERKIALRFSHDSFLRVSSPAWCMHQTFLEYPLFSRTSCFNGTSRRATPRKDTQIERARGNVFFLRVLRFNALLFSTSIRPFDLPTFSRYASPPLVPSPIVDHGRKSAFLTFLLRCHSATKDDRLDVKND